MSSTVTENRKMVGGPREMLWTHGASALSDDQLVAILLGTGRKGLPVLELAREVVGNAGLSGLLTVSACRLARRGGVGQVKAARLVAALELGRRALAAPLVRGEPLQQPADVAAVYSPRLSQRAEQFVVVHLDSRHRVLGETVIAQGGADRCPVPVREVFTAALEQCAAAIICVHNHPSGDPSPSERDRSLTRRLVQAGKVVGVPLLDHVIVAKVGYTSLHELGLLTEQRVNCTGENGRTW